CRERRTKSRRSCHGGSLPVFGTVPLAALEHGAEMPDRGVDFRLADEERRDPEAENVRGAEIADYAAGDERLDDGVAFGVRERDLAAAPRRVARRDEAERRAARFHARDEAFG